MIRSAWERIEQRRIDQANAEKAALDSEARELKRARIMNRKEPGYERKNGKL
jgi:hypothetical protein